MMQKIKEIYASVKKINWEKIKTVFDWSKMRARLEKIEWPTWPEGFGAWKERVAEVWGEKKRPIVGGALVLALVVILGVFFQKEVFDSTPFEWSGRVDNLVFGDLKNEAFEKAVKEVNLANKKLPEKDFGAVLAEARNIFFGLSKDEAGNYSFLNPLAEEQTLALGRVADGERNLKAIFDEKNQKMDFVTEGASFGLEGTKIEVKEQPIYSIRDLPADSIVQLGEMNIDLGKYTDDASVAESLVKAGKIKASSEIGPNLLDPSIASFSAGLWNDKVGDCSNGDPGEPKMSMRLFWGALMLSSSNHSACASRTFPVKIEKGKVYKIAFDYRAQKGNKAKYYYQLAGKDVKPVSYSEDFKPGNTVWNHYSTLIQPEANFESINFHFYAPSDGKEELVNFYDNVVFEEVKFERPIKVENLAKDGTENALVSGIKLKAGENKVEALSDAKNLLAGGDASFEGGLWKDKVGDCCNGQSGEAKISMEASSEKTDGAKSLKLSSNNHCACSSKTFPVSLDDGKKYKLSFDYKNLSGGSAQYYYRLANGTGKDETKSAKIEAKDKNWHNFEVVIDSKLKGVKTIDIFFYASSDGKSEVTNLYDNVKLTEWLPKDMEDYYLHREQKLDEAPKLGAIEYRATGRNENRVLLHGVRGAFLLIYPEEYSEKWQAVPVKAAAVPKGLAVAAGYAVPDEEMNRQASVEELEQMIEGKLISATGKKFISKNFNGAIRNENLPEGSMFETWSAKPIAESLHYKMNDYSNAWWINPTEICGENGAGSGLCVENEDGSWEMALVVKK